MLMLVCTYHKGWWSNQFLITDIHINIVATHPVERGILNFLVCLVVAELNS